MSTMSDQPTREARSELRRWCDISHTHQDADDPICGWNMWGQPHKLRLRRMLICSVCEMGFFKRADFESHECWSAY